MYNNDILNKGAAKAAERPYYEFGDTLYHYTNLTALNGMLFGKKELWLGEDSFMNDTKELTDFIDKLKTACLGSTNQDKQQKYIKFFDKVYAHVKSNYPYIMSFSRRIDDAAQWERYADNARGFCIGFNTYNLARILFAIIFMVIPFPHQTPHHSQTAKLRQKILIVPISAHHLWYNISKE